ncbi:MAG: DUF1559 domain-containing protein [Candidatus Brocadiia bacterium]
MRKMSRGFTLIEVLVVLAIIAVVATIIVAYASQARESARNMACQSNLGIIGRAIQAYSAANKGFMPGGHLGNSETNSTALVTSLLTYKQIVPFIVADAVISELSKALPPPVFKCPEDDEVYGVKWEDNVGYQTSYLYNAVEMTDGTIIDATNSTGVVYTDSAAPAKPRARSFFDYQANWKNGINEPSRQEMAIDWTPVKEAGEGTSFRHFKNLGTSREGSNVLFLDGHVEFVIAAPSDLTFETGFDFFKDCDPFADDIKNRYWIRWISRKY